VRAARASLGVALKDLERQRLLQQQGFISAAAFDRAEAQFKATEAQVAAQLAQAGATRTQSGFYVVKAPYAGVVADVPVMLGDMAMPGRTLLTLYDPRSMRVAASVPQSAIVRLAAGQTLDVELLGGRRIAPVRTTVLPTADPATHTVQLRFDLPDAIDGVAPGMFARAWLPLQGDLSARVYVPGQAVFKRAELSAVYVVDAAGRPLLRPVRLGGSAGDTVEVLSGVSAGERVALEPQAAARMP
jgi:RND family efflux transporter MFP subunit